MSGPTMGEVIAAYVRMRDKVAAITAEAKEKTDKLNAAMAKIETFIKTQADAQGVTSFKSEHGTAFVSTVDFAGVDNWDAVLDYIKTNNAYDMLNKAVNKTAVRAYIEEHKAVPPGVTYGTKMTINVRKPSAKAD